MNAQIYVDVDKGIQRGKNGCTKWKKKSKLVFLYIKYSKFEAFVWHEAQTSDFWRVNIVGQRPGLVYNTFNRLACTDVIFM